MESHFSNAGVSRVIVILDYAVFTRAVVPAAVMLQHRPVRSCQVELEIFRQES